MTKATLSVSCSKEKAPVAALVVAGLAGDSEHVVFEWKDGVNAAQVVQGGVTIKNNLPVARLCARYLATPTNELYGVNALQASEIDHWVDVCLTRLTGKETEGALKGLFAELNTHLKTRTFLVAYKATLADAAVWSSVRELSSFVSLLNSGDVFPHLMRWYRTCMGLSSFQSVDKAHPAVMKEASGEVKKVEQKDKSPSSKEQGVFVDLPNAEIGKVITRFPPEASGYLHIGHAKAALLNNHYARSFKGKLLMRFDDTNPSKEKEMFEKEILEDLELLRIKPDLYSHTSDHFEYMFKCADKLIRDGNAYVDDTPVEEMRAQRMDGIESKARNNSVEKNLALFEDMKRGTPQGLKSVLRAKINMQEPNKAMRDPVMYRCNTEPHVRTGTKYIAYPTYDFACPIVDSIEDVTHALRTTEYHDRNPQFYWVCEKLELRKPHICDFSRVNMVYTLLSKRKLHFFVNNNYVEGWDDPRMPTVRGILRRGLTIEALTEFIIAQGSSKSIVLMEWDKIWNMNRKVLDPIAPRLNAVSKVNVCTVKFSGNVKEEVKDMPKHKKNADVGTKKVAYGKEILLDQDDAKDLVEGEEVTLMDWGNCIIKKVHKKGNVVTSVDAVLNLDGDFKKTKKKLTWLCKGSLLKNVECEFCEFDNLIIKKKLEDGDNFEDFVNKNTKVVKSYIGDPDMKNLKKGDIIQIQRLGYFIVDVPLSASNDKMVLFSIPDGKGKAVLSGAAAAAAPAPSTKPAPLTGGASKATVDLFAKITQQGDLVRKLKSEKAEKAKVTEAVQVLLKLKDQYKQATGEEYNALNAPKSVVKVEAPKAASVSGSGNNATLECFNKITKQGDLVRKLKGDKADKAKITEQVKVLLALKEEYKTISGTEYDPKKPPSHSERSSVAAAPASASVSAVTSTQGGAAMALFEKVTKQGELIRELKSQKADKAKVTEQVQILLKLKTEYKDATGAEYNASSPPKTSGSSPAKKTSVPANLSGHGAELFAEIKALESQKFVPMSTGEHDKYVKNLVQMKTKFLALTGLEYNAHGIPSTATPASAPSTASVSCDLYDKVTAQGEIVRDLKSKKAEKSSIDAAVKQLLALKEQYKKKYNVDYKAGCMPGSRVADNATSAPVVPKLKKGEGKKKPEKKESAAPQKGVTRLGMEVKKDEDFASWYSQVITKGEMIEYYDVSGCYIIRPWAFAMWDIVKNFIDKEISKIGVTNCYFPMFVTNSALEKEKEHIEDFAPEVAWVTKSGNSELSDYLAIRPTSETVMYPTFAKWIKSHRELPLKVNQWCNVVRWEFKNPQPFLRTREFLWQEGHTAWVDQDEAIEEVMYILDLYRQVYEDLYACPVIPGKKSPKEKFAGGDFTMTVEGYIPATGRGIQGATSHSLGQNFAKMFDLSYEDPSKTDGSRKYVWQNSWGLTTRSIGVAVMVHGDDRGLVLPPRVAAIQVIIVACGVGNSTKEEDKNALFSKCKELKNNLMSADIRADVDLRTNYSPGWKFNHWELKGVPIRIELGPRDLAKNQAVAVRRDTMAKVEVTLDGFEANIQKLLDTIHTEMFKRAKSIQDANISTVYDFKDFVPALDKKHLILSPWCNSIPCEEAIKNNSARQADEIADPNMPSMGAKCLCNPVKQPELAKDAKCINCGEDAVIFGLFGRSY
eukprot:Nk52_evm19s1360 gene=Nk52_evmTU19s1360